MHSILADFDVLNSPSRLMCLIAPFLLPTSYLSEKVASVSLSLYLSLSLSLSLWGGGRTNSPVDGAGKDTLEHSGRGQQGHPHHAPEPPTLPHRRVGKPATLPLSFSLSSHQTNHPLHENQES
jgi:hypothetical protein